MKRKLLYIVNPISGTRSKSSLREIIKEKTTAAEFEFTIYPSVESGDYSFLFPIIKEQNFTDVIIAGGDGTINQVVNSLRKLKVQFGIIPCGSGNGLAFSAGIPKNSEKALQIIFKGKSEWCDAFLINETFACMLVGLGLDAQVAHDFANDPKRGLTTYIKKTVANFFTAKTYSIVLTTNGKKMKTDALFVSIANSNQFGNHFTIAPKASLNDGLLDIVVMTKQNKLVALLQAFRQVSGYNKLQRVEVIDEKASMLYFQTDEIKIHNPQLAPIHIDGDPVETAKEFNVEILKDAFRLIYP
ncbi:MAG TPA: YegS/Rv2252/BmrU family lipid kinase [Flavisolibacter sp.]|nr:YegS/Rv2252/BmrU family lipid kinase [Flavisolibacter sp.]